MKRESSDQPRALRISAAQADQSIPVRNYVFGEYANNECPGQTASHLILCCIKISADDRLKYLFPKKTEDFNISYNGDNLHEMLNPVFTRISNTSKAGYSLELVTYGVLIGSKVGNFSETKNISATDIIFGPIRIIISPTKINISSIIINPTNNQLY